MSEDLPTIRRVSTRVVFEDERVSVREDGIELAHRESAEDTGLRPPTS